jgi:hypothetical protein
MIQESIPGAAETFPRALFETSRLLEFRPLGDAEIVENLRQVQIFDDSYLCGMDAETGVGWAFLKNQIFLYRYIDGEFTKQTLNYYDLSRSQSIKQIRPVIFCGETNHCYAIFTTGTELVLITLFKPNLSKHKVALPHLDLEEHIIQLSLPLFISGNSSIQFASVTNMSSVFVHTVSKDDRFSIETKRLDRSKPSFFNIFSAKKRGEEKEYIKRAKITLLQENVVELIRPGCIEEIDTRGQIWVQDIDVGILDGSITRERDRKIGVFLVRDGVHVVLKMYEWKYNDDTCNILEQVILASGAETDAHPPFGRIIQIDRKFFIILRVNNEQRILRAKRDFRNFSMEKCKDLVVGVSAFTSTDGSLTVFTHNGVFTVKQDGVENRDSVRERRVLRPRKIIDDRRGDFQEFIVHFFPTTESEVKKALDAELKTTDSVLQVGFYDFYHKRTTGIIQLLPNLPTHFLDNFIKRMAHSFTTMLTPNQSLYGTVGSSPGHKRESPEESMIIFDLNQTYNKINRFVDFLSMNDLMGIASADGKLALVAAVEAIAAARALRQIEENGLQTGSSRSVRSVTHKVIPQVLKQVVEVANLKVYEKVSTSWKVLEEIIRQRSSQNQEIEQIVSILITVFSAVQRAREEMLTKLGLKSLQNPWWIHSDSFILGDIQDLFTSVLHRLAPEATTSFVKVLIPEVQTILNYLPNSAPHQEFLQRLFSGLYNSHQGSTAYQLACDTKNPDFLAATIVSQNLPGGLDKIDENINEFGDEFLHKLIDLALEMILSDKPDEQCTNALAVLNLEAYQPKIRNYILSSKPQLYWLFLAKCGDHKSALDIVEENSLISTAFVSMLTASVTGRDPVSNLSKLHTAYAMEALLPHSLHSAKLVDQITYILDSPSLTLSPSDRVSMAFNYSLAYTVHTAIGDSLLPIFKYALRQDRGMDIPKIHIKHWGLFMKAVNVLECRKYNDCLQMSGIYERLDQEDWDTVDKVLRIKGDDFQRY